VDIGGRACVGREIGKARARNEAHYLMDRRARRLRFLTSANYGGVWATLLLLLLLLRQTKCFAARL